MDHKELIALLKSNQLDQAIHITKEELKQLPSTEFHKILEINWMPLAEGVAAYIDKFYKSATKKLKRVETVYCEMNAFTINYDAWYVQFFAYSKFIDKDDLDWLADYDYSNNDNALSFTGLEEIQSIFKDYIENKKWKDKMQEKAFELSSILIILGIQELFRQSSTVARLKKSQWAEFPLFVTAHDYDLIFNATNS